ncbi:MAG TPA: GDSL-type esterase/lipase family protein [Candidatus Hydrogenedentes bacterium]|nr:GDSL-type esterase/lipase family protein [Candidatus Hydrogenedentota bacterium]HQH50930.1 GDSL-type esterase/lipase family protein [Candidatus Hydrogenedentota bacterium]
MRRFRTSGLVKAIALGVSALVCGCGSSYKHAANLDTPNQGIVCLGDSLTSGYGATPGNSYPEHLSRLLGERVVNAGIEGDTSGDALARLKEDVLSRSPRLVIVLVGGNDFLQQIPREQTVENVERIVAQCVAARSMVILIHLKAGVLSDPYYDGFEAVAERHGAVFVPEILKGIFGKPRLMSDQIHPNDQGYAVMAERIAEAAAPLLEAADEVRRANETP